MANMHLVTGYAGKEHVKATDHAAFNAALIGTGQFVLDKGNVFEAQVISNNQIRILDGEMMMQGRFIRLDPGTYVDLTIENGTQGKKRNDLVVARYTKNTSTNVEAVDLCVIKGTTAESNPADPEYTEGDITNGEAVRHDFPLWRIPLDGLNVGEPVSLFGEPFIDSMRTLPEIRQQVNDIMDDVDEKIAGIDSYLKTEVLTDTTKAKFGLGADAVPDDVFGVLSRFQNGLGNEYVWAKTRNSIVTSDNLISDAAISNASTSVKYSDTCGIENGVVVLTGNIKTITVNNTTAAANLVGKYFVTPLAQGATVLTQYQNVVLYCPSNATPKYSGNGVWVIVPFYGCEVQETSYGYVNSPDPTAYPIGDGYNYTALGQLGAKVRIATGSYVGTGTCSIGNENVLTFAFTPKIWGVYAYLQNGNGQSNRYALPNFFPWGRNDISPKTNTQIEQFFKSPTASIGNIVTYEGNTVKWYNATSADNQLNAKDPSTGVGYTYYYFAIG